MPEIGGESIVSGGEDGKEVIFGGLNGTFSRERTMLVRGGKGDGCVVGFEEGTERLGGFVVNVEMCDGVIVGVKEIDDVCEGGAVGGRGA